MFDFKASLRLALVAASAWTFHEVRAEGEAPVGEARPMYIREYRVRGVKSGVVGSAEIGEAVYPFLGPGQMPADVDRARAAVEKLYHDKGYQAVAVAIPVQQIKRGTVILEVSENPVGRLRVKGARFTSPSALKGLAPALAEGRVVNFNEVTKNLVAMNQLGGRTVTPELRPGVEPGTVDIDLKVKDGLPLHGSLEVNNRYSANTSELRLNGAVSYDNLWQLGHAMGMSFQVAPLDLEDAQVFSGYYLAPLSNGWSLMLQGTKQDSNVSTLGGLAVAGRGEILGLRVLKTLPQGRDFYQSLSFGLDYKHFDEDLTSSTGTIQAPLTYYPLTALYTASLKHKSGKTDFNGGVTLHLRGMGASADEFNNKRYKSAGSFLYFRGDLSHTGTCRTGCRASRGCRARCRASRWSTASSSRRAASARCAATSKAKRWATTR
ncbi:ShlB/FhaC/HecB family hemolysin secretion/activation protein [Luteolibacter ambystomatis]|uniref:ShlB/FhaC/HecB family hemolysin secretion/activation protein n=2 Tax=Luteolibacter ambystomatis TaxID=2824561 RepID=A0A975J0F7_9BACT|nr:ShlB/FhaC/HecB family hemolysin secretion/activation protein [Luteolibacter ambystomatis]QUE51739.1 ShlB/FhaC/HecB family hemolysin secretion/activation protein [Luteolibacter ambystomatis]